VRQFWSRCKLIAAIFLLLLTYFTNAYTQVTYALDDIKIRETFAEYDIVYQNLSTSNVSGATREIISKTPTKLQTGDNAFDGYEVLSKRTANSKTYATSADQNITEVYLDTVHKKVGDLYVDIDNSLTEENGVYHNKVGIYDVSFYDEGQYLYSLSDGENNLKVRFENANLNNRVAQSNRLVYSDVYPDINLEYIAANSYLKENVIFNAPAGTDKFSYIVDIGGANIKKQNSVLCVYRNDDGCDFEIRAPYMEDKDGKVSEDVAIDFEKLSDTEVKITLTYDMAWINAPERVFPVTLDPATTPTSGTINIDSSYIRSGSGWQNITSIYGHLFVGYDKNGSASNGNYLGQTRTFIAFDMPDIGENRRIESATLELERRVTYGITDIDVYKTSNYVDPETVNWLNQPTDLTFVSSNYIPASLGFKSFDIKSYIEDLNAGSRKTLMVRATVEDTSDYPAVFNSQHEGASSVPKITILHRPNYDVDENLDLNSFDNSLRVYATGLNDFKATSMDGIASPDSTVKFRLYKKDESGKTYLKDFTASDKADFYFIDPVYISNPLSAVQTYLKENVNYTSDYHQRTEFDLSDTVYGYNIVVEKGGATSTREFETDDFIFYKVKLGDNLSTIASYYGVAIDTILADNNFTDPTIKEGDELFIRLAKNNPRLSADVYTPKTTLSQFEAEFEYLGPVCDCEGDPINSFTGNFFYETTDAVLKDFTDINLSRTYNSKSEKYSTTFGRGWSFNFEKSIAYDKDGNMLFLRGDGSIVKFAKNGNNFVPDVTDYYEIARAGGVVSIKDLVEQNTYVFNAFGMLERIVDDNGREITVEYDNFGDIIRLFVMGNKTVSFVYNQQKLVSQIILPNGDTLDYQYNDKRELIKHIDAAGFAEEYFYDDNSKITKILDKKGAEIARNTYDAEGRVLLQAAPSSEEYVFSYGDHETTITVGDRTRIVEYDEDSRLTKQIFVDGASTSRTYDERNNVLKEINELGQEKTYVYDAENNLVKITDYNGDVTEYEYDGSNLVKEIDPNGNVKKYAYDAKNNLIQFIDEFNNETRYAYNSASQKISETDRYGSVTYYTYENGNLKTATHPNGLVETYYYDTLGNLIRRTESSGKDTQYIYDQNSNLIKEIDTYGNRSEYFYDGVGNKIEYVNKLGGKTVYVYDGENRLVSEKAGVKITTYEYNLDAQVVRQTDQFGNYYIYEYDGKGRLIKTLDNRGNLSTKQYDAADRVTKEMDEFGNVTEYQFDGRGLLTTKNVAGVNESYEYDAKNRLIKTTFDNGTFEKLTYDEVGNLVKKVDSKNNIFEYQYDANKNMIEERQTFDNQLLTITNTYENNLLKTAADSNGKVATNSYDQFGRLVATQDNLGKSVRYDYDLYQNVILETDENNHQKTTAYDLLNRKIKESDWLGNNTTYEYDAGDNVTKTTDGRGFFETTIYDAFNNKLLFADKNNHQTVYEYNGVGLLAKQIDAYGVETVYNYDTFGQLTDIFQAGRRIASYHYDNYGRTNGETKFDEAVAYFHDTQSNIVKQINYKTGIITETSFDKHNNKTAERDNYNQDNVYEYDAHQRLIKTVDKTGRSEITEYDSRDNIVKATVNGMETTSTYDVYGRLETKTEKGLQMVYEYDNYDRVIKETTNAERVIQKNYNRNGQVIAEIDALGQTTRYEYDAENKLTKATDRNGSVTTYEYDGRGNKTKETNANGNSKTYAYDIYDNVIRETDELGNYQQFKYNSLGQMEESVDKNGFATTYEYDDLFRLEIVNYPYGFTEKYTYDEHGNIGEIKQKNGHTVEYSYDLGGNIVWEKSATGGVTTSTYDFRGNKTSETDPLGYTVYFTYNDQDFVTEEYDEYQTINQYIYDDNYNLITEIDANQNETNYTYDAYGNVIFVKTATKNIAKTYDNDNNLIGEVTNDLITKTFAYDHEGNQLTETTNGEITSRKQYDAVYNVTSETDDKNIEVVRSYDAGNQVTTVELGGDIIFRYAYDRNGNIAEETDIYGSKQQYLYDTNNNLMSKTDALGNTYLYESDGAGNVTKSKDPEGNIINYVYDGNNNLIEKDFMGTKEHFVYDKNNHVVFQKDQYGAATVYTYDHRGHQISENSAGNEIIYQYDYLDNLLKKSAKNIQITHTYNSDNLKISTKDNVGISTFSYDFAGNLVEARDANGKIVRYVYDTKGNQTEIIYPDGSQVEYVYVDNQVSKVFENGQEIISYAYDVIGNEVVASRPDGFATEKQYDKLGRVTAIKNFDQSGKTLSQFNYVYDSMDNVTEETAVQDGKTSQKLYKYNNRDELIEETANGTTTSYSYNALGNKLKDVITDANGSLITKTYAYQNNQLTNITEVNATGKTTSTTLTYDPRGNLIKSKTPTETETYTYDSLNRLTGYTNNRYIYTYTYDGNDNRLQKTVEDKYLKKVEEDRVNSLTMRELDEILEDEVYTEEGLTKSFERLRKQLEDWDNGATCEGGVINSNYYYTTYTYVNDQTKPNPEILSIYKNRNPHPDQTEIYNSNQKTNPERIKTNDNYYLTSKNQTVTAILNPQTQNLSPVTYTNAHGLTNTKTTTTITTSENQFTYTGELKDGNNLIYLRARYYNPKYQIFLTKDTHKGTLSDPLTQNQYIYANNNPTKYTDPSGHFIWFLAAALAAAAIGVIATPRDVGAPPTPVSPERKKYEADIQEGIEKSKPNGLLDIVTDFVPGVYALKCLVGIRRNGDPTTSALSVGSLMYTVNRIFKVGAQVSNSPNLNAKDLTMSETVKGHIGEIARDGTLSRPYMGSAGQNLLVQEIMDSSVPVKDLFLQNGLRWSVGGTMNGSHGEWQLVVDLAKKEVVHLLFKSY
jgi:RHS repeat-associated protein